jgi:hypothetical protein
MITDYDISGMVMNGGYDSTINGAKGGSMGSPIYINPIQFHIKVTSFEISSEILK